MRRLVLAVLGAAAFSASAWGQQGGPASAPAPGRRPEVTGSAEKGKSVYLAYGCYACHGYNGQTGNGARLQPPRLNQQQFVLYIRAPRTLQMPAYTTKVLSDAEAADIYAYVVSLPREPELKDVPLLGQLPR